MDDVHDEDPTWQPISALPTLIRHAAEGVRLAREHLDLLGEASPYRLDDATVAREIATWQTTRDDLDQLFAEQGRRWQQQAQGTRREGEVEHYRALVAEERDLVEQILTLAHRLESTTIEKLLAKTDLEAGVETMLGGPPDWQQDYPQH